MDVSLVVEELRKLEAERIAKVRADLLADLTEIQREVALDPHRFKALCCSRRAGKTTLDATLITLALLEAVKGDWVIYAALTMGHARDLIWGLLVDLNDKHQLGWELSEHEGIIETPKGAKLRLLGFDNKTQLDKVLGYRVKLFIADEPQSYASRLKKLYENLAPALSDHAGMMICNGTPGVARAGFWFEIASGKHGFKQWHWNVRQNTKYPRDVETMLREERERNGWTETHPTYMREYLGIWIEDLTLLVYEYSEAKNLCQLPDGYSPGAEGWRHYMGIDYGFTDAAAWTVLAHQRNSKIVYVVWAEKVSGLLGDEIAAHTKALVELYKPSIVVGDAASAQDIAEYNRRYGKEMGTYIQGARKLGKKAAIGQFNTDLRAGRLLLCTPTADELVGEIQVLPYKNELKEEEDPAFENHCADSALYIHRECSAFLEKPLAGVKTAEELEEEARERRRQRVKAAQSTSRW